MPKEDFIVRTWPFLLLSFVFILSAMTLGKYYGEEEFHLLINQFNHSVADLFFRFYTKTGEWLFGSILFFWLIWKSNWRMVFSFLTASFLQFLLVQSIKRGFFIDHLRPAYYFQEKGIDLHLVDGVKQGITYTFPSGHTATTFFVFLFICLIIKNRWLQLLMAFLAILSAYSRMYLSQHFVWDTAAGALIGVSTVIISYYIWNRTTSPFLNKKVI